MENLFLKIEFSGLRHKNNRPLWKDSILKISRMKEKKLNFILRKQNFFCINRIDLFQKY
jgi:hypothetical protein